jgi:hypothetical protein
MPKSATSALNALEVFLRGVDPSYRGNANRYLALHTSDPNAGDQTTGEATYTGYARLAIPISGGWTGTGSPLSNTSLLQFGLCTVGTNVITHISIGVASSGASQIIYSGALNASRTISPGNQPQIAIGALTAAES